MNIQIRVSNDSVTDQVVHQGGAAVEALETLAKLASSGCFRSISMIADPSNATLLHISGVPSIIAGLFSDVVTRKNSEEKKK